MKYLVVALLATSLVGVTPPQALDAQTADVIPHVLTLASGEDRRLAVSLPPSYEALPDARFPVLYVLDGESNLEHASSVVAYLSDAGVMPETIVVGLFAGATRTMDYLPPSDVEGAPAGRADLYLESLEADVLPFIDGMYRTGDFRMISGHSYGGVLVTWTSIDRPDLFDAYLTQSPYLDDAIGSELVDAFARLAEEEHGPDFFFANVGAEPNLAPNVARLGDAVRREGGTVGGIVEEAGADHMMTRLVGLHDGLVRFFETFWRIDPSRVATEGVGVFAAHVAGVEARMGFIPPLGEATYQRVVSVLLQTGNAQAALDLVDRYAGEYSASPTAHFLRGNVRAATGDRDGAVVAITTAIELYEADPDPRLAALYASMVGLVRQLGGG